MTYFTQASLAAGRAHRLGLLPWSALRKESVMQIVGRAADLPGSAATWQSRLPRRLRRSSRAAEPASGRSDPPALHRDDWQPAGEPARADKPVLMPYHGGRHIPAAIFSSGYRYGHYRTVGLLRKRPRDGSARPLAAIVPRLLPERRVSSYYCSSAGLAGMVRCYPGGTLSLDTPVN